MATETSNIDDVLAGSMVKQPEARIPEPEPEEVEYELQDEAQDTEIHDEVNDDSMPDEEDQEAAVERDDYGNEKQASRTYTEEEVNERIRRAVTDRLSRVKQEAPLQHSPNSEFEYDPESSEPWQAQLEKFVESTINKVTQKQLNQQHQQKEQRAQVEFETNFTNGMQKFSDFREVVGSQDITDPMTYALRGMKDPASFLYAASKRQSSELQRISRIEDPYAQVMEMGKLEERMRKSPMTTSAPKPVSRSRDDGTIRQKSPKKELSIDDMIAQSDAKRRATLIQQRRGR